MRATEQRRPGNLINRIITILLYLIMLFTQLQHGQLFAVLATCLLFYVAFLYSLVRRHNLDANGLICCWLWLFMVVYLVRPEYLADIETKIEILWLVVGLVMLLTASMNLEYMSISPSILYNSALLGALLIIVSMITKSTLGGLLGVPYANTRYVGGFDGPNEMGAFYVLALTLMLGEHILRRRVRFVWAKASVFVIVIIQSWSRSALGALLVMGVLCFCWAYFQNRGSGRLKVVAVFLLLLTLVGYAYVHVVRPQYNVIRANAGDRRYLLETANYIVKQKPICGHGLGSYWFVGDGVNATPHSEYLLFVVSGGMLGLVFLVGFYTYWLKTALNKRMYPESIALLVFYVLEAFFNNLVRGRVSFFFWVLILLVSTGPRRKCSEDDDCSSGRTSLTV
jgi:O-antigen ligase